MDTKIVLFLLIASIFYTSASRSENNEKVVEAVKALISDFFLHKYSNINLIKTNENEVNEMVAGVLKSSSEKFTFQIDDYKSSSLNRSSDKKRFLNLIILSSVESFIDLAKSLNTNIFSRNGFFFDRLFRSKFKRLQQNF